MKDILGTLGLLSSSASSEVIKGFRLEQLNIVFNFCEPVSVCALTLIVQVLEQLKDMALVRAGITREQVQEIIEERKVARDSKDWAKSDLMRKELEAKGIALMDGTKSQPTTWKPCIPTELEQPVDDGGVNVTANGQSKVHV